VSRAISADREPSAAPDRERAVDVSVVCPFFNEAEIIDRALRTLLERLARRTDRWELIVVDDGSTDGGGATARALAARFPALRVLGYRDNRGRGYALRTGIAAARGDVIVTTEIDLSWGEDIVDRLVDALQAHSEADMVVASPHLADGGYRNVPAARVWLSRLGNRVIRACLPGAPTMNTGMTRAYRRAAIQTLPLFEDGKELHLEVVLKATAFAYRIHEIPALLEWKDFRRGRRARRDRSFQNSRLIVSHALFSLLANPVRYVWALSFLTFVVGLVACMSSASLLLLGRAKWEGLAYAVLGGLTSLVLSFVFFVLGAVVKQGSMIMRELWMVQRMHLEARHAPEIKPDDGGNGADLDD
jgi:glycosyltransferase involved in cell wall biosynthesis